MEHVAIFYGHLPILWQSGILFAHLVSIFLRFGIVFPVLIFRTKKNLTTLLPAHGLRLGAANPGSFLFSFIYLIP
jgi:hypothetical protein